MSLLTRRRALITGGLGLAGMTLSGCDRLNATPSFMQILGGAENLTRASQRTLIGGHALAREFSERDLSADFKANGSTMPTDGEYQAHLEKGFADWTLAVDGLVQRPAAFSLAQLRALPSRTQITRHDCVEGWSAIGKWTGVPLGLVLKSVGLKPNARFVVLHCADDLEQTLDGTGRYYESIDLVDAFHPQTLLAYAMNGQPLPVAHGAPLRLRVERQLGYKQAKFVMRLEVVSSFASLGRGKGGFWEDRGYEWYAGI
jgi:DMSO/TMAO reductase YedYZ molybdopterin-dependent catalytic subunit